MNNGYTYEELQKDIEGFKVYGDIIKTSVIGKSLYSREIPMLRIGQGDKNIAYIGAHHGMESITSAFLIRFTDYLCSKIINGGNISKNDYKNANAYFEKPQNGDNAASEEFLFEKIYNSYSFYIIPMLNPDGVTIATAGIEKSTAHLSPSDKKHYLEQLKYFNRNNPDFSRWQANGRGVDINHNYAFGFAAYKKIESDLGIYNGAPTRYSGIYPESEPETQAMCHFLRKTDTELMLTFHSQGEELYGGDFYSKNDLKKTQFQNQKAINSRPVGRYLENTTGYKVAKPEGAAAYGGLTDWYLPTFNRPAYTVEVGRGVNPLPMSDLDEICQKLFYAMITVPFIL